MGELDASGAQSLKSAIAGARSHGPRLILDLSQLEFMDGWGLRTVIEADIEARRAGVTLQIREGPSVVQKVFKLTGFDRQLNFLPAAAATGLA